MKTNRNFRYNIVFFMIFLIVTIPFYVSNVYASVDTNSGIKEITGYAVADSSGMDPGEACSDKVEKTNSYVELLENDVVVVIEEVLRKAYAICTIMSAIELILSALGVFPGNAACDASAWCPVVYLAAVCKILCWVHKIFGYIYETPLIGGKSLCQIIACSWCPVSAWDNIYSGMGCLCLSSVLFNLRKLKVIYDTYGACTEAACRDGISTEGCEQGFCEEECKYWKGTRASFFTQLMTIIVTWAIMRFILNKYSQMLKTWANLVEVPLLLLSLYSGWQYVTYEFSEVSADDFNFKNLYQDRDPMSSTIDIGKSNYKGKQIKRMSITKYREENPDYAKYGIGEKDTGTVTTYGNEKIVVVNKKGFGGTNKYFKDGNGKEYVNRNGRVIKMENIRFKSFKNVEVDGKKYDVTMDEHGNVKSAKSGGKDVSLTKDKKAELQKSVEKENDESQNIRRGKGPLAKQHDAQVVRQAVSVVVGYIIGKWMQDGVEDQCKKECESSEPSEDLMAGDTTGIVMDCEGRSTTTGTAQFTITDYDIEYRYDYSFTLESCRQDITYSVYMRGDSEKVLASGTLAVGSREVNTDGFYGTDNYVQICIQTDDDLFGYHGLACFPVLSEETSVELSGSRTRGSADNIEYSYSYSVYAGEYITYDVYLNSSEGAHTIAENKLDYGYLKSDSGTYISQIDYTQICVKTSDGLEKCQNYNAVLNEIGSFVIDEDSLFSYNATTSPESDNVIFSDNTSLFNIGQSTGEIRFTPTQNDVGDNYINISVSDGIFTDSKVVLISVIWVDDAPVINLPSSIRILEDTSYMLNLSEYGYDEENDTITWQAESSENIAVTLENNIAELVPDANWNGEQTVVVRASDGTSESYFNLSVIVSSVSDNPWVSPAVLDQTREEDSGEWSIDLTDNENDIDDSNENLRWSVSNVNSSLISAYMSNPNEDILTFTTKADKNGENIITLTLSDSAGLTAEQNLTVRITSVNDAPVLDLSRISPISIPRGGLTTLNLNNYVNDVDHDDSELSWIRSGHLCIDVSIANGIATLRHSGGGGCPSTENILLRVADPEGGIDSDVLTVNVG